MFMTAKDKEKEKKKIDKVKAAGGKLIAISRTTSQESRRSAHASKEVSRPGSNASSAGSQRGGEAAAVCLIDLAHFISFSHGIISMSVMAYRSGCSSHLLRAGRLPLPWSSH